MTAIEHLKHRLATGTLGGDQDERDVSELIAEAGVRKPHIPCAKCQCTYEVGSTCMCDEKNSESLLAPEIVKIALQLGVVAEGFALTGPQLLLISSDCQKKISTLEAALAQKTRECERLTEELDHARRFWKFYVDKSEQLQRQVAELQRQLNQGMADSSIAARAVRT